MTNYAVGERVEYFHSFFNRRFSATVTKVTSRPTGASGQRAGQWRPEAGDGERPSFLDEINLAGAVA
jgi:hypothetical protein